MASVQASKGSSDRTTPDMPAPPQAATAPLQHDVAQAEAQMHGAAATSIQTVVEQQHQQAAYYHHQQHPQQMSIQEQHQQMNDNAGYASYADGTQVGIQYDELKPNMAHQVPQYSGPHKVVPAAPSEPRQMTDAEKLKADKEQLKLNLQNFRKTQKTAKQIQQAKQQAAIQAQKNSMGLNSTYQAFDLQNYKSPEDCFLGLQSAKKMLQQSNMFQGTTAAAAADKVTLAPESTTITGQPANTVYNNSAAQVTSQVQMMAAPRHAPPQISHQPPPPQARRKRFHHDLKDTAEQMHPFMLSNHATSRVNQQSNTEHQQPVFASRRPGRFVPQAQPEPALPQASARVTGDFNQNVHPNLTNGGKNANTTAGQAFYQQHQVQPHLQTQPQAAAKAGHLSQQHQQQQHYARQQQQQHWEYQREQQQYQEQTPQNGANNWPSQQQENKIPNFNAQLEKIATCLNYDQVEMSRLFQQKYNELMLEHQHQAATAIQHHNHLRKGAAPQKQSAVNTQQFVQSTSVQEPNLGLLLQLVQNDLLAKQQADQQRQIEQQNAAPLTQNSRIIQNQQIRANYSHQQQPWSSQHHQQQTYQQPLPQQQQQMSSDPSAQASSGQQSASSTAGVMMNTDDVGCCDSPSDAHQANHHHHQVLLSDDDECDDEDVDADCNNDINDVGGNQRHLVPKGRQNGTFASIQALTEAELAYQNEHQRCYYHHEEGQARYDAEEDIEEIDDNEEEIMRDGNEDIDEDEARAEYGHHEFMGQQTMGCYGGDQTEAYEQQHQNQPIQMMNYVDQQYHQFSQSDYVEAVEGFTAEDEDEAVVASGTAKANGHIYHSEDDDQDGNCYYADEGEQEDDIIYQQDGHQRYRHHQHHQQHHHLHSHQQDGHQVYKEEEIEEDDEGEEGEECYEHEGQVEVDEDEEDDELEEDEYIEEEHQYTLNELYAQAHKQLLANGLGSKEDIRAWQALYPRLIGGGLTPQNLEQMINLGQANLTPQQAQEIFNYQQKQLSEGLAAAGGHHQQQTIIVDEDGNQHPTDHHYEWCSQESDEESNYGGELIEESQHAQDQHQDSNNNDNQGNEPYQEDDLQAVQEQYNLIHSTLQPPSHLSLGFKRFFSEFENNIDFILRWDYEILPQQRSPFVCKAEQKRLKNKYENLLTASRDMCRRFTGPHSVLQIFLEKIVASINFVSESLKESTLKDLGLWIEVQYPFSNTQQQLRKQVTSSSVLIGHQKRSSSANPELLITKTSKTSNDSSGESGQAQPENVKQPSQPQQIYYTQLKPKPLLECIDNYTQFLEELRNQYLLIMNTCAPKISKHFTKLTAVIVENTQYEFPSTEIHKAVISKLILNDQRYFKQLVQHIQQEFQAQESLIREQYGDFVRALELFLREVDDDMRANQTKIDIYMRDLRKHALDEYEDLYRDEQEMIKQGRNAEGKKKRKKRKRKNKNAANAQDEDGEEGEEAAEMKEQDEFEVQPELSQQQPNQAEYEEDKREPEESPDQLQDPDAAMRPNPDQPGKKKKRNRRNKKKAQDSVTNELLNNLDTDDLVDFINNCGSKKEDLKKSNGTKAEVQANTTQQATKKANETGEQAVRRPDAASEQESSQKMPNSQGAKTTAKAAVEPTEEVTPSSGGKVHLSRKQRRELRAAQAIEKQKSAEAASCVPEPNDTNLQANEGQTTSEKSKEEAVDQVTEETKELPSESGLTKDEIDSDIAFEDLYQQYCDSLKLSAVSVRQGQKMQPNVGKEWLKEIRQCLQRLDKRQQQLQNSKRRAQSSSLPINN